MNQFAQSRVDDFFSYATERYNVFLKREMEMPPPWTDDPVISRYRFCNIFREDDKVTKWYAENIRKPMRGAKGDLVFATIVFRLFNRPETCEQLLKAGVFEKWSKAKAKKAIAGLSPVVSPAYIIIGAPGFSKGEGIIEILDVIYPFRHELYKDFKRDKSLQKACETLSDFDRMGMFLAYEVVTDLRHTEVLGDAHDIMSWANPGPGAARGLSRLLGQPKEHFNRNSKNDVVIMMELMKELLEMANTKADCWPSNWPRWEMREVEHTLCEYDKWERARSNEGRPKQRYSAC